MPGEQGQKSKVMEKHKEKEKMFSFLEEIMENEQILTDKRFMKDTELSY